MALAILSIILWVAFVIIMGILRKGHEDKIKIKHQRYHSEEDYDQFRKRNPFSFSLKLQRTLYLIPAILICFGLFKWSMFYAERGYNYHVRTIFGDEKFVTDVGWNAKFGNRINLWKTDMSVTSEGIELPDVSGENESTVGSARVPLENVIFLDNVDANVSTVVRFRLPNDKEQFKQLVSDYRTPDNFIRQALIPALRETVHASGSLMTMEDYFNGARTNFQNDFQTQLTNGIFQVKRMAITEDLKDSDVAKKQIANASAVAVNNVDDDTKTTYIVKKMTNKDGSHKVKRQSYLEYGVTVVSAHVTNVIPNKIFQKRMEDKQDASAKRAIAIEQRLMEEENRLKEIAKGKRLAAEEEAKALVRQVKETTEAETDKQLAIVKAEKLREQAEIDKERSQILLDKSRLDAEAVQVTADAEAYAKKAIIEADNALAQKLDALVKIAQVNAEAQAKRQVPQTVIYSGGDKNGLGQANDVQNILDTQLIKNVRGLDLDMSIKK